MGTYISQTDLENQFGAANVAEWSNRANDGSGANTTVIADAIGYAEQYVEDRFRNGRYTIPFVSEGGTLYVVKDWCQKIAANKLYQGRPPTSRDNDRMANLVEGIENEMDSYLSGQRAMPAARVYAGQTAMVVVCEGPRP